MDKLKQETADLTQENIARIGELFPNVITELKDGDGKPKKGINFELLKQELSGNVVDGEESYDFTWVGKKASIVEANTPIRKTLRPCIEESKDWETTENLYIEGDNLDVLKLLQESYLNSVKMIYIDPPYNTGKDFIYKDKFMIDKKDYEGQLGMYDELGNRLFQNKETEGRFHSDWCSMMYSRLKLARSLLTEDGVIFISIDDNEVQNLRKICDDVFGEENFIEVLKWKRKKQPSFLGKHTAKMMEYVLVYARNQNNLEKLSIESISDSTKKVINISNNESTRIFKPGVEVKGMDSGVIKAGRYLIKTMEVEYLSDVIVDNSKTTNEIIVSSKFSVSQEKIDNFIEEKLLYITAQKGLRRYVSETEKDTRKSITDLLLDEWGDNQESDKQIIELFGEKIFETPKPIQLVHNLASSIYTENTIILDFFSGSATTAHAVMQLNAEDGGNRKFIMVQLPEPCDEKSKAFMAGYKNICEIGKERIRRAGDKINKEIKEGNRQLKLEEEPKKPVDIGFRVLKVDTTNMKDVFYAPSEYTQKTLTDQISNIKEDRTDLDLLYGVLLEWGLPLSLKHEIEEIDGIKIHIVDNDALIACFAESISEAVVRGIAKRQPLRAVFRDSSFTSSSDKINVEEIFKLLAPNTSVKVI
jgi:adenine-specific DNA-methyltransferase